MERIEKMLSGESNSLRAILIRAGLWCLSQPYAALVWARNRAYDRGWKKSTKVEVPVISVGNLTAGGTGKSPTVAMLARWFRARDMRVAILSRGYGAGADGRNDEAKELECFLPDVPHLQDPDRVASAAIAVDELGMEVLLLDDGFQHRKIHRDLEIVLLDAREPFGFGHLIPRGLLREPLSSLRRASIVIATRANQVDSQRLAEMRTRVQRYNPKAAWMEAEHHPVRLRNDFADHLPIEWLHGKRVLAVSGLGNPSGFHATLEGCGATILNAMTFPDHHPYSALDVANIELCAAQLQSPCDAIICTGKDLAKLQIDRIGLIPLWSLDVELKLRTGAEVLDEYLGRICEMCSLSRAA